MTEGSGRQGLPDFDALWDYDRPGETERAFRELVATAEASGDRDPHLAPRLPVKGKARPKARGGHGQGSLF